MNSKIIFGIAILICIVAGCNSSMSEDKVYKASELKSGEKIGDFTIAEVNTDDNVLNLRFEGETVVEGLMMFEQSPTMISVNASTLSGKIEFNGSTIDLSEYKTVSFINYQELATYIPEDWREESMTDDWQLKAEKNNKINVKVKIKDIVFDSEAPNTISATIIEVIAFDGNESPAPVKTVKVNNLKAKFDMVILSTDGGWNRFYDADGIEYMFFDDGNEQVHNVFSGIEPNNPDNKFSNRWYELEYKTVFQDFYDGGTGNTEKREVKIITSITESK